VLATSRSQRASNQPVDAAQNGASTVPAKIAMLQTKATKAGLFMTAQNLQRPPREVRAFRRFSIVELGWSRSPSQGGQRPGSASFRASADCIIGFMPDDLLDA
jgi:hypothetical protein